MDPFSFLLGFNAGLVCMVVTEMWLVRHYVGRALRAINTHAQAGPVE